MPDEMEVLGDSVSAFNIGLTLDVNVNSVQGRDLGSAVCGQ
jgi:hypothetical protein